MKRNLTLLLIVIPTLIIFAQTKSSAKNYTRYDCSAVRDFDEFLTSDNFTNCNCKRYMSYSILIEKSKITISAFEQGKFNNKTIYDNLLMEENKDFYMYKRDDGRENGEQDFMEIVITKNKKKIMYYWMDYSYNPHQVLYILK
jgi:hypothetical protein